MGLRCSLKFWLLVVSAIATPCSGFARPSSIVSGSRTIKTDFQQREDNPLVFQPISSLVSLEAAGSGKKRKKRRRKDKTTESAPRTEAAPQEAVASVAPTEEKVSAEEVSKDNIFDIKDVANFEFEGYGPTSIDEAPLKGGGAIPLPDIRETLKKKEEEEQARIEEEKLKEKSRIKRSDKEAFTRLLEQQPYADADDSLFEKEAYTTVSALLGEGSKPFLGIPTGPLQVGHFIGSLGIILMAFVTYPGFPLTNLPTPLRDFLQAGLAVTYTINLVLAVVAAFKAGERDQSAFLWGAKTFSVGGLAYDQLTQLPTIEEAEQAKSRKL